MDIAYPSLKLMKNKSAMEEIQQHAHKYAHEVAGAMWSVATAYARHYCAIVEAEQDTVYWPSHHTEFWRWLKHQPIKDWRE